MKNHHKIKKSNNLLLDKYHQVVPQGKRFINDHKRLRDMERLINNLRKKVA